MSTSNSYREYIPLTLWSKTHNLLIIWYGQLFRVSWKLLSSLGLLYATMSSQFWCTARNFSFNIIPTLIVVNLCHLKTILWKCYSLFCWEPSNFPLVLQFHSTENKLINWMWVVIHDGFINFKFEWSRWLFNIINPAFYTSVFYFSTCYVICSAFFPWTIGYYYCSNWSCFYCLLWKAEVWFWLPNILT